MQKLTLPKVFTIDAFYEVINIMWAIINNSPKNVLIDFSSLQSIEVGGIAALSNIIEYIKHKGIDVQCINAETCRSNAFLYGSGFIDKHTDTPDNTAKNNQEFLKLEFVQYDRSFSYIANNLIPWLSDALECDPRALASIQVCFQEIFNNIRDHSDVNIGCSCAHNAKDQQKILICISDFGVGIPARVRASMKIGSDHAAIAMACQEGFTTKTTPRNMGAGLTILIRNIVARNSGRVSIYSGKGIYDCFPDQKKIGLGRASKIPYPGTVVYITIDTQKFVPSEIEEVFSW